MRRFYKHGIGAVLAILVALASLPSAANAQLVTAADLKKISPKANDALVEAFVAAEAEFEAAGINTRIRMAHFIAQVMTETGGLRRLDENMNYSAKTLLRVFSRRTVSAADAQRIARKPIEVANWVYGARLGNLGRDTMDGWNYRGSGYIQLTGRDNFRARGNALGLPLEEQPDMARQAKEGLLAAIAYWDANNINRAADDNDRKRIRKLVNGPAAHGLPQAVEWFNRSWVRVFRGKGDAGFESSETLAENTTTDDLSGFDAILESSNLLPDGVTTESSTDVDKEAAIRAFQEELGLPETGILDEDTQLELLDPREWRHREDDVVASLPDPELTRAFDIVEASETVDAAPIAMGTEGGTGTESSALPVTMTSAGAGTGSSDGVETLPGDILNFLEVAKAEYAPYEMGDKVDDPDGFIPFSVIGEDTREVVLNTSEFPSSAVVQILFKNRLGRESLCTGAMVSKDTVLTAGHCIHSGTRNGRPFKDYTIIPGRNTGTQQFGICKARRLYALTGWTDAATAIDARYYDLGAIKLDCDAGLQTGWFGMRLLEDEEVELPTKVQGYANDLPPFGRQWVSEDKLRFLFEMKGFYQNDTFGGTSGSPVYTPAEDNTIIGVHTNGLHGDEPWKSNNAFTRITQSRLDLIRSWIDDQ